MKFYNPFKWHIVQFENGMFGIRRYHMLSWEYRERPEFGKWSWFLSEHVLKYCMFDTLAQAQELKDLLIPKKIIVEKVYG